MEIKVEGNIDRAIRELRKLTDRSGLVRELKLRSWPKKSLRRREKVRLAIKRRRLHEARRGHYDRERKDRQAPAWIFLKQDGAYFKVHISKREIYKKISNLCGG